jgi:hypothetical protein
MTAGNMERGKRMILNRERPTKAFSASRTLLISDSMYTANVVNDTCKKKSMQNALEISSNVDNVMNSKEKLSTFIFRSHMKKLLVAQVEHFFVVEVKNKMELLVIHGITRCNIMPVHQ